jgi:small-conductance mechanosensitive channel
MQEFQKLHMDATRQFSELQMQFMNLWLECNSSQMQRLAGSKKPSDAMETESEMANEYMKKFADNAQQALDTLTDIQQKMFVWMQDNNLLAQFNDSAGQKSRTRSKKKPAS